jgi:hypothetical protein
MYHLEEMRHNVTQIGFYRLYEPSALDIINIDEFRLLNVEERSRDNMIKDVQPELSTRLTTVAYYFKTQYIDPVWDNARYNKFTIWEGVDRDNQGWHTDFFEGYDLFMLYYLDDTFEESGGHIEFKWATGEYKYQPKRGDLLLVNNLRGFWHRAGSSTITRRVASFDFNVGLATTEDAL